MPRPALSGDRALQVIDVLVAHPTQRFTLTELSRRTAINPASAHALLAVMLRAGYVQRHPEHKTYTLGPALVAAGDTPAAARAPPRPRRPSPGPPPRRTPIDRGAL